MMTRNPTLQVLKVTGARDCSLIIMCQEKFAEMASQITEKEKSNSYSAYSFFRILSIECNLKIKQHS